MKLTSRSYVLCIVAVILSTYTIQALKLDRVILATNNNPLYIEFWPYVAKAWTQLIGIKPTLALIADEDVKIDESLGDVIRFKPLPGVPDGLYAQVIRLLLPAYFPNDGCIISDIDQLPLQRSYFVNTIASVPDNQFIVYNNWCYGKTTPRYPMCYVAAKGQVFKKLFDIQTVEDIPTIVERWASMGLGFDTDETILYHTLVNWKFYKTECTKLNDTLGLLDKRRILDNRKASSAPLHYKPHLVRKNFYVDAFLPRPYSKYKTELDNLAYLAGIR
ncbi:hypothetical protein H0X48_03950 [Candidatus Dependentiae bacterium]|nr:hypothetical protein [Candidatus Dependentiae bacterium]